MTAYYNENDRFAASWLRELIADRLVVDGEVDDKSIIDVRPDDRRGYSQCHFFAGISGWSHALRFARWSDDRPVWTGSCPCQPFSVAGTQAGGCEWIRPIIVEEADRLTTTTKRALLAHNELYEEFCRDD